MPPRHRSMGWQWTAQTHAQNMGLGTFYALVAMCYEATLSPKQANTLPAALFCFKIWQHTTPPLARHGRSCSRRSVKQAYLVSMTPRNPESRQQAGTKSANKLESKCARLAVASRGVCIQGRPTEGWTSSSLAVGRGNRDREHWSASLCLLSHLITQPRVSLLKRPWSNPTDQYNLDHTCLGLR